MSSRPDFWVKNIITNYKPTERVATFHNANERCLILWTGCREIGQTSIEGFWVYSIPDVNWTWVELKHKIENFPIYGFSMNYIHEKFLIFGQYQG